MATGSVILNNIFIHLASNPDEYLSVEGTTFDENTEGPEESVLMSGGNVTRSLGKGAKFTFPVVLDRIPRASVDTLRTWIEVELVLRDPRGRSVVGGIEGKSISMSEHHAIDAADISFTFAATGIPYVILEE